MKLTTDELDEFARIYQEHFGDLPPRREVEQIATGVVEIIKMIS